MNIIKLDQTKTHANMENITLLDSDSDATMFCNPEYAKNSWNGKERVKVDTNGER